MTDSRDVVKAGDYIVIQRQDYFKLHKVAANSPVQLGKDVLDLSSVIGQPVWLTYRMEQKKGGKRNYELIQCSPDERGGNPVALNTLKSGTDNRNIVDDGSSQKLSMEEIVNLRDEGLSSKAIVGTLIENSKTFHSKTEYSQQKYLKKKEKKYFEYVIIRKPSVRLIADIMFRRDPGKIMGLRMDTLSQLVTAVNLHSHGTYILYESGCQGLPAAALLNNICGDGRLILVHTGGFPQKQAVLALNLSEEQENCLITVNIYNLLRKLKTNMGANSSAEQTECHKADANVETPVLSTEAKINADSSEDQVACTINSEESSETSNCEPKNENKCQEEEKDSDIEDNGECIENSDKSHDEFKNENKCQEEGKKSGIEDNGECTQVSTGKRKHLDSGDQDDESQKKRPRWEIETDRAVKALSLKADGLILVCREHPGTVLKAFLPFIAPSRNFVVYCQVREPLQELLLELKQRQDVINLRLTSSWLRQYQVETDRTHPLVNMSGSGGYLLTGVVVEKVNK